MEAPGLTIGVEIEMGSFNYVCCISNLPIEAGDKVRFLALARNTYEPDGNGHACYVTGRWQLHGVPLKAQYNDYGSVEGIERAGTSRLFFQGLAANAVEKGTGDNACHDVAVRKEMSDKEWLNALWEGRVFVQDQRPGSAIPGEAEYEPTKGVPTLSRIEKVLHEAGYVTSKSYGAKGFMLDEVTPGYMRVRLSSFEDNQQPELLNPMVDVIQKAGYAAMITAGSGNYAKTAEILVGPLPSTDSNVYIHASLAHEPFNEPRPVSQAMIREDVWQILLRSAVRGGNYTIDSMREAAQTALQEDFAQKAKLDALVAEYGNMTSDQISEHKLSEFRRGLRRSEMSMDNLFLSSLSGSEGVSGFNFRAAYRLAQEVLRDPEELTAYVLDLAETIYVQWAYSSLHGQWHPTSNGGQDGRWKEHRAFLNELLTIKGVWEEDDDEDDTDNDEEE